MSTARYLSPAERQSLLNQLSSARDRLLVTLGLNTGFRIGELLSLRWRQLVHRGQPVNAVEVARQNLKGGRSRYARQVRSRRVPLNATAAAAVREWVFAEFGSQSPEPEGWVFRSRKSTPGVITRRHARDIIAQAAFRAGLEGTVAPHSLRKCFAADVYRAAGHDLLLVRDLLGHSSALTTERYLPRNERQADIVLTLGAAAAPAAGADLGAVALRM